MMPNNSQKGFKSKVILIDVYKFVYIQLQEGLE